MTDRKRREHLSQEIMFRSEKLSSIEVLTSGAVHDILNPAAIISLYARRMYRHSGDREKVLESAEIIQENINRINEICENLRCLCQSKKTSMDMLEPTEILKETLNFFVHVLKSADVSLELFLCGKKMRIVGDRDRIQQVFVHLINNAIDEMPTGGVIVVTTDKIVVDDKDWWELRFVDSGQGISDEIMSHLFDPFFTTKPVGEGTGLGLSVSHEIIRNHGGRIWAENIPDKGACFIVLLPLAGDDI